MNQDPFNNFKPLNSQRQQKKNRQFGGGFLEQIKSIGSSVADSISNDVVKGAAQGIFEQIVGSTKSGQAPKKNNSDLNLESLEDIIKQREEVAAEEADKNARKEEREFFKQQKGQEKVLFSFADEQLKKEINAVRQEIAVLVKSMGKVQQQIEQAVIQEVVNPGIYHKNFFQNLRSWIKQMQKSMNDASLWLSMSTSRKQRGAFWSNAKRHGNKYTMSQERQMAMNVG